MDLALNNLQRLICHKTQPTLLSLILMAQLIVAAETATVSLGVRGVLTLQQRLS